MRTRVEVPEPVRRKAMAVGPDGARWLDELDGIVGSLEAEWEIRVGAAMTGGSGGYVANATTQQGELAVLKISIPDGLEGQSPFAYELETLRLGDGHGYVRVLRADIERRAMLQERLGRSLVSLALPVESQIDVIATTLRNAWHRPTDVTSLRTEADQAHWIGECTRPEWEAAGRPCAITTIERAEQFARARRDSFDPATAVLIHGDAHPANVLEARSDAPAPRPNGFKLIDPDGMLSEPAHDLAIPLRDWTAELLAADPVERGLAWCTRLGARAGIDSRPIWEWAFVERVSTGLFLMRLGDHAVGRRFLEVADLWTGVD